MLGVSRRDVLRLGVAGLSTALVAGRARAASRIIAGAIRWDAWDATGSPIETAAEATLGPRQYQARAPFCAKPASPDAISFAGCNAQAIMDSEISYASQSGLAYWAYCWYRDSDPMMNAWRLHQASVHKDRMNWCVLWQFGNMKDGPNLNPQIPTYINYFRQSNYQKVLGGRPLFFIFMYNGQMVATSSSEDWANVHTALNNLRAACASAGLASPYIVILHAPPLEAQNILSRVSADAISNYISSVPPHLPASYGALDTVVQDYWAQMAATGAPIVPICMTGWDPRARIQYSLATKGEPKPKATMSDYVVAGTPQQIAAHIQAAARFTLSKPSVCPARTILIYSWDECSEGGSALIPSYTAAGPDPGILQAVGTILNGG